MGREEIRRLCLNVWASPAVSPGGATPRPLQNSAKPAIDTREELAKIAGVSHDTIARGELALKRKHIIAAKAKKNQACGAGRCFAFTEFCESNRKNRHSERDRQDRRGVPRHYRPGCMSRAAAPFPLGAETSRADRLEGGPGFFRDGRHVSGWGPESGRAVRAVRGRGGRLRAALWRLRDALSGSTGNGFVSDALLPLVASRAVCVGRIYSGLWRNYG